MPVRLRKQKLWLAVTTFFLSLTSAFNLLAFEPNTPVVKRLVYFEPALQVSLKAKGSGSYSSTKPACLGFIYSDSLLALPTVCIEKNLDSMSHKTVTVLDSDGRTIGRLPDYSRSEFSLILTRLSQFSATGQSMLLPFISLPDMQESTGTAVSQSGLQHLPQLNITEINKRAANDVHYLYHDKAVSGASSWQSVQLGMAADIENLRFSVNHSADGSVAIGSPVVNKQGQVVCLLNENNQCEPLVQQAALAVAADCQHQLPYMTCSNISWQHCADGLAIGTCKNLRHEKCLILTAVDGFSKTAGKLDLKCRNNKGCGVIGCPESMINGTAADCMGLWGFCLGPVKAEIRPSGCLSGHSDLEGASCRCTNSCPKGAGFYGMVIGIPVASVALTAVLTAAVMVGIYKYRTRGYQVIPDIQ